MGRCLYKRLGSDQGMGSSLNHLRTFLYLSCNMITLSLSSYSPPVRKSTHKEHRDYGNSLSDGLPDIELRYCDSFIKT